MPVVSVIVPVYNVEKYIEKSVKSIKNQTLKDIEILLVDDGSTDTSGEICDQMAKEDPRIRVFHKKNGGVSSARNLGLDNAKGDYISFCDADDWMEPDMLEILYKMAMKYEMMIPMVGHSIDFSNKRVRAENYPCIQIFDIEKAIYYLHIRKKVYHYIFDKIFSKKLINETRFKEELISGEDYTFLINVLLNSKGIVGVSVPKYHYVQRKNSFCNGGYNPKIKRSLENYKAVALKLSLKFPRMESIFNSHYLLEAMSTIPAMVKNENYDQQLIKEVVKLVRNNLKSYICVKEVPFYLKVSALLIGFNSKCFICIYRLLYRYKNFS